MLTTLQIIYAYLAGAVIGIAIIILTLIYRKKLIEIGRIFLLLLGIATALNCGYMALSIIFSPGGYI
jgi:hypothetical protein